VKGDQRNRAGGRQGRLGVRVRQTSELTEGFTWGFHQKKMLDAPEKQRRNPLGGKGENSSKKMFGTVAI